MTAAREYYGAHLGSLSQLHHGVSGDVYAVDSRTLFLKNFNYDGEGPGNYFYFILFFYFYNTGFCFIDKIIQVDLINSIILSFDLSTKLFFID